MSFLKNAWYVAAESHEVADGLLGRVICGDPVVLYRTDSGAPAALEDRCCHRNSAQTGPAFPCPDNRRCRRARMSGPILWPNATVISGYGRATRTRRTKP